MPDSGILEELKGGDRRSIGLVSEVVRQVLKRPELVDNTKIRLFDCGRAMRSRRSRGGIPSGFDRHVVGFCDWYPGQRLLPALKRRPNKRPRPTEHTRGSVGLRKSSRPPRR